ncbi:hypothetical protein Y032_0337g2902 [Ancylostoma ceylanicum]|uniref:Uncharacterized protein n=1 Tax=Ancylostoma ceylanicum TaxID=53326 RepID=A0A016RYG5_9BILA|nr:hypothetical protein Y032_0337g2902 [Ancylostoma ceylanicum]
MVLGEATLCRPGAAKSTVIPRALRDQSAATPSAAAVAMGMGRNTWLFQNSYGVKAMQFHRSCTELVMRKQAK